MLSISGKITNLEDTLEVEYFLTNNNRDRVYVCAVVLDAGGESIVDCGYTALTEDRKKVVIKVGESPVPAFEDVEYLVEGLFQLVEKNETVKFRLVFKTPLLEWNAYTLAIHDPTSPIRLVRDLSLRVDTIAEKQATIVGETGNLFNVIGQKETLSLDLQSDTSFRVAEAKGDFQRRPN